jgi:hypothetical protein
MDEIWKKKNLTTALINTKKFSRNKLFRKGIKRAQYKKVTTALEDVAMCRN